MESVCTASVELSMGGFSEISLGEADDDGRRESAVDKVQTGFRDTSDAPSIGDEVRVEVPHDVLRVKNDTTAMVGVLAEVEELLKTAGRDEMSREVEVRRQVVCALYAPKRGPPTGFLTLITHVAAAPRVGWTKSLIASRLAERDRARRTGAAAYPVGERAGPAAAEHALEPMRDLVPPSMGRMSVGPKVALESGKTGPDVDLPSQPSFSLRISQDDMGVDDREGRNTGKTGDEADMPSQPSFSLGISQGAMGVDEKSEALVDMSKEVGGARAPSRPTTPLVLRRVTQVSMSGLPM